MHYLIPIDQVQKMLGSWDEFEEYVRDEGFTEETFLSSFTLPKVFHIKSFEELSTWVTQHMFLIVQEAGESSHYKRVPKSMPIMTGFINSYAPETVYVLFTDFGADEEGHIVSHSAPSTFFSSIY